MTNGAEEEQDMGEGLRHLPSRKTDSSLRLWGEEWRNADSGGGMKNWQEEKARMDLREEKGLKHMWKGIVNTSPLLPVGHSH